MKKTILLFFILLAPVFVWSQCCPYIDGIEIQPDSPNNSTETTFIFTVTTPNLGSFLGASYSIENYEIQIESCYFSGELTALQTYVDTLNFGVLPDGDYNLTFTAFQTMNTTICDSTDFQNSSTTFTVEEVNGIIEYQKSDFVIYPNPINDNYFFVESNDAIQEIIILNLQGKILKTIEEGSTNNPITKIRIADLSNGTYLLQIKTIKGDIISHEIVISRK